MGALTENSTLNVTNDNYDINFKDIRIIKNEIPRIKIEENSLGIILVLPEQVMRYVKEDFIEWQIIYNDDYNSTVVIKSELIKRKEDCTSKETTLILNPANTYCINLFIDNNKICSWTFEGISDSKRFLCFDLDKNYVRSDVIPREECVIVFKSEYMLSKNNLVSSEIDGYLNWKGYKFYSINPKENKNIFLRKFDRMFKIPVENMARPRFIGGEKLFGVYNESKNFTELPYIKLYQHVDTLKYEIVISNNETGENIKEVKDIKFVQKGNYIIFPLENEFIKPNSYGVYAVKILLDEEVVFEEEIIYTQEFDLEIDNECTWPKGLKGYNYDSVALKNNSNVNIELNDLADPQEDSKYILENNKDFVDGKVYFKNDNFNFKKQLKPILWQWMDSNKSEINWDTKCKKISYYELKASSFILIKTNQNFYSHLKATVKLKNMKGETCNEISFKLYNNRVNKLFINIFQNIIQRLSNKDFYIDLEIKDNKGVSISECSLAVVQEKLYTYDYNLLIDYEDLVISWSEDGVKTGRKLLLYNLYSPFKKPYIYELEDGKTEYRVNGFKKTYNKAKYGILIKKSEDCISLNLNLELLNLKRLKKIFNFKSGSNLKGDKIDLFFNKLISYFFKEDVDILGVINEYNEIFTEEIVSKISYAYIYISNNCNLEKRVEVDRIFRTIFGKFVNVDKYYILKEIIKINLNKKNFETLVLKWNLLSLPVLNSCELSITQREYLWDNMMILGFIADMRSIPIDKKNASKKIVNFIDNIRDLIKFEGYEFKDDEELINYLEKNLWNDNYYNKFSFSLDFNSLGTNNDIKKYFKYECNNVTCKKSIKRSKDFYIKYEDSNLDDGTKILGKTYLKTYLDWNKKVIREKKDLIEMRLNEYINKADIGKEIEKHIKILDNDLLDIIKMRTDLNNKKFEHCGNIMYLNSVFVSINKNNKNLSDLVSYIYKKIDDIATRDIILMELNRKFSNPNKIFYSMEIAN